jgi:peptide/nickel transport system substrate-binding protein
MNRRSLLAGAGAAGLASAAGVRLAAAQDRRALRIGVNGVPRTLEPVNAISNVGPRIVDQVFDRLIRRDFFAGGAPGNGQTLVPGLAERWERVDDSAVRFFLRRGVTFHDGAEFTAEDVAFTFSSERLWGDAAREFVPNGRAFSPNWDEPVVEDSHTVVLRTKTPSALIEQYAASWIGNIVPKAAYQALGAVEFGNRPVGTGPYRFVEFIANDRVVIEANDAFWGEPAPAARITYQVVGEPATRVAGLISGEYDIVTTLTPDDMALIGRYDDIETRGQVIENVHMFTFNMNQPIFRSKELRRAMSLSIDRALIVEALWQNKAVIPNGFNFPHYGATYEADRATFAYDLDAARALVKASGYDGAPIPYRTGTYYANSIPAMMMMIEMWKQVGLNIVPDIAAPGTTVPDEQIFIRTWSNGQWLSDAVPTLVSEFGPRRGIQTRWGWQAPAEFNELCDQVERLADGPERAAAFSRLRDIFDEEAPAVLLYQPFDVYGARKDVAWRPVTFETMNLRADNLALA